MQLQVLLICNLKQSPGPYNSRYYYASNTFQVV